MDTGLYIRDYETSVDLLTDSGLKLELDGEKRTQTELFRMHGTARTTHHLLDIESQARTQMLWRYVDGGKTHTSVQGFCKSESVDVHLVKQTT